jgi:hypothetical protein
MSLIRKMKIAAAAAMVLALVPTWQISAQTAPDEEDAQQRPNTDGSKKGGPTQLKKVPSAKATPIEIPGKGKPEVKKPPSAKATPIEIPGKGKPVVKKAPSAKATPIEIPGKGKPVVKKVPSAKQKLEPQPKS